MIILVGVFVAGIVLGIIGTLFMGTNPYNPHQVSPKWIEDHRYTRGGDQL